MKPKCARFMSPTFRPFSTARLRRRFALFMAVAVLIGGIAQAAHYHKVELAQRGDVHLQCLLCMASAGSAGPPDAPRLVQSAVICVVCSAPLPTPRPESLNAASYDARGPPQV